MVSPLPSAILAVLVLATPLPWRRRGRALVWGLLLIQVFIVFRLTLLLLDGGFAADKAYALFTPGPFADWAISNGRTIFCNNPTISWLFPVFVWFLVLLPNWIWRLSDKPSAAVKKKAGGAATKK